MVVRSLNEVAGTKYLINHFNILFKKGVLELPIGKIIVDKCKIKRMRKGDEEGDFLYHITFKKKTYPINASCNQELLEFVQMVIHG